MFLLNPSGALHVNSNQIIDSSSHPTAVDSAQSQQVHQRTLKCYRAYFQSWCRAFGEHEKIPVNDHAGCWLLGENQIGLVLTKPLFRQFNREIYFQGKTPTLVFDEQGARIGQFFYRFKSKPEKQVLGAIDRLFETGAALHLFRTCHHLYRNGNRILTISSKRPQPVIYREIGAMNVKLQ